MDMIEVVNDSSPEKRYLSRTLYGTTHNDFRSYTGWQHHRLNRRDLDSADSLQAIKITIARL